MGLTRLAIYRPVIALTVIGAIALFVWWRLGMPGRRRTA